MQIYSPFGRGHGVNYLQYLAKMGHFPYPFFICCYLDWGKPSKLEPEVAESAEYLAKPFAASATITLKYWRSAKSVILLRRLILPVVNR